MYTKLSSQEKDDRLLVDEGIERAVLGCLIKQPALMTECVSRLKDTDFVNENNKYLYSIMTAIYNKTGGHNVSFDTSTLLSLARQKGVEEDFIRKSGGSEYIEFLNIVKDSMISIDKFKFYLETLSNYSIRRKLYENVELFKQEIQNSDTNPEELIIKQQNKVNDILLNSANNNRVIHNISVNLDKFIEDSFKVKKNLIGISTGFKEFDRYIEGLRRKALTVICAPRKTGKTAFLGNIGINVGIRQGIPTLMISTEMGDDEIICRILSNLSGVQYNKILKGQLDDKERVFFKQASEKLRNGKFYHITMRDFTLEKIVACVRKFVYNTVGFNEDGTVKDCLVIFDYIKLPQEGGNGKERKEYRELSQLEDGLKILAGDMDIPFLTACQTNRAGEVANSFELTWFCDTWAELTKKTQKELDKDQAENVYLGNQRLKITAQRAGEENHTGINFDYNGPTLSYIEIANER